MVHDTFFFVCFLAHHSDLMDADPGFHEGGHVLWHPCDEAVRLVVHKVELLSHLCAVAPCSGAVT